MPTALLKCAEYGNSIQILISSPDVAFRLQMVSKKQLPCLCSSTAFCCYACEVYCWKVLLGQDNSSMLGVDQHVPDATGVAACTLATSLHQHACNETCMQIGPCHFLGRRVHGFTILHACRPLAAGEGQQMMDVSKFGMLLRQ